MNIKIVGSRSNTRRKAAAKKIEKAISGKPSERLKVIMHDIADGLDSGDIDHAWMDDCLKQVRQIAKELKKQGN